MGTYAIRDLRINCTFNYSANQKPDLNYPNHVGNLNSYGKNDLGSWNNYESQMIPNPYGNNSLTSPSLEKWFYKSYKSLLNCLAYVSSPLIIPLQSLGKAMQSSEKAQSPERRKGQNLKEKP